MPHPRRAFPAAHAGAAHGARPPAMRRAFALILAFMVTSAAASILSAPRSELASATLRSKGLMFFGTVSLLCLWGVALMLSLFQLVGALLACRPLPSMSSLLVTRLTRRSRPPLYSRDFLPRRAMDW